MMNIELTDDEARLFMEFREHQALLTSLISLGLFTLRRGSMTLSYGINGEMSIEVRKLTTLDKA